MLLNTMLTRGGLIFTSVKKLKPCGSDFPPIYSINSRYSIKVQELTDPFHKTDHNSPAPGISMSSTYLDKAIEAVPRFAERISFFTKKLRLAQYADSTIYSYRLKVSI